MANLKILNTLGNLIANDQLAVMGENIPYTLRRVPRRRRLSLHVSDDAEVIVRIPLRASLREAREFVHSHAPWVAKRLALVRAQLARRRPLEEASRLPLLDTELTLRLHHAAHGRVDRHDEALHVHSPCHERAGIVRLLEIWYRNEAQTYMAGRLALLAEKTGLYPKRITIRGQKTCWGSCSARGTISLNWRLMLAPAVLVDYVLTHELCHLRHLNHSAAFWDLVEGLDPDCHAHRVALRRLQPSLVL
ncbi:MAG: M48 family metallopeptidase [Gammaproteobacteria bacterium]|nr:M48 family metallopeptidase [Gammaproteobacteria bacterium]